MIKTLTRPFLGRQITQAEITSAFRCVVWHSLLSRIEFLLNRTRAADGDEGKK
jgi:hypothetical protein